MRLSTTLAILATVAISYTACMTQMAPKTEEADQSTEPAAAPAPVTLQEAELRARQKVAVGGLVAADAVHAGGEGLPGRQGSFEPGRQPAPGLGR